MPARTTTTGTGASTSVAKPFSQISPYVTHPASFRFLSFSFAPPIQLATSHSSSRHRAGVLHLVIYARAQAEYLYAYGCGSFVQFDPRDLGTHGVRCEPS